MPNNFLNYLLEQEDLIDQDILTIAKFQPTVEYVQAYVNDIEAIQYDAETAHSLEDELRAMFIKYIAERDDELGHLARIILSTNNLSFPRWCA